MRRMTAIRSPYVRDEWFKAIRFDADKEVRYLEVGRTLYVEADLGGRIFFQRLVCLTVSNPLPPSVNNLEQIQRSTHSCGRRFRPE